ncbi:MAG: CBS domain-containing protein [Acidobacteria bacterium]|nr:CBS domain-containing protein [Acidobacteriota bacterium]
MKTVGMIVCGREIVTVGGSTCVLEAARLMAARHIAALPIVEGDRLAGIFTERDIVTRIVAAGLDPATTPVGRVMSTGLLVADVGESCEVCLRRMQQAHVRHLLILDQGRLAGIISLRDLMTVDLDEKAEAISLLNEYVSYIPAHLQANTQT